MHEPLVPQAPEEQSESTTQLWQTLPEHIGASAEQSLFITHCTQVLSLVSHTGVAAAQSVFATHCTHAPIEQIVLLPSPANPGHCELLSQVASQRLWLEQNGSWALQSADDVQVSATHWFAMHTSPLVHM